jgi:TonB family protein
VEVQLALDAEGNVTNVTPIGKYSGTMGHLARIAADAARRWKFKPATLDGKPVPAQHVIRFQFGQQP